MIIPAGEPIAELIEQQLNEAVWLAAQRRRAAGSAEHDVASLAELDERLAANVDALVIAGRYAYPYLWTALEGEGGTDVALVVATVTLSSAQGPDEIVPFFEAMLAMGRDELRGARLALTWGPSNRVSAWLETPSVTEVSTKRALTLVAQAAQQNMTPELISELLRMTSARKPAERECAWAGLLAVTCRAPFLLPSDVVQRGLSEVDEEIGPLAAEAVLRSNGRGARDELRSLAFQQSLTTHGQRRLFAALGEPGDAPLIEMWLADVQLGPERFDLAAAFGYPSVVRTLLLAMNGPSPDDAAAAAAAFERLTGIEVPCFSAPQNDNHAPSEDAVASPDAAAAAQMWSAAADQYEPAQRLHRGRIAASVQVATLDLRAQTDELHVSHPRAAW